MSIFFGFSGVWPLRWRKIGSGAFVGVSSKFGKNVALICAAHWCKKKVCEIKKKVAESKKNSGRKNEVESKKTKFVEVKEKLEIKKSLWEKKRKLEVKKKFWKLNEKVFGQTLSLKVRVN